MYLYVQSQCNHKPANKELKTLKPWLCIYSYRKPEKMFTNIIHKKCNMKSLDVIILFYILLNLISYLHLRTLKIFFSKS